jgi:hypothetical protein
MQEPASDSRVRTGMILQGHASVDLNDEFQPYQGGSMKGRFIVAIVAAAALFLPDVTEAQSPGSIELGVVGAFTVYDDEVGLENAPRIGGRAGSSSSRTSLSSSTGRTPNPICPTLRGGRIGSSSGTSSSRAGSSTPTGSASLPVSSWVPAIPTITTAHLVGLDPVAVGRAASWVSGTPSPSGSPPVWKEPGTTCPKMKTPSSPGPRP